MTVSSTSSQSLSAILQKIPPASESTDPNSLHDRDNVHQETPQALKSKKRSYDCWVESSRTVCILTSQDPKRDWKASQEDLQQITIQEWEKVIQEHPHEGVIYCNLARSLKDKSSITILNEKLTPIDLYYKSLVYSSKRSEPYLYLANYLADQEDAVYLVGEKAKWIKSLYIKSIELNPHYSLAYTGLADTLRTGESCILSNQKVMNQEQLCDKAYQLTPDHNEVYRCQARCSEAYLLSYDRLKTPLEMYLQAIKINPHNRKAYIGIFDEMMHASDRAFVTTLLDQYHLTPALVLQKGFQFHENPPYVTPLYLTSDQKDSLIWMISIDMLTEEALSLFEKKALCLAMLQQRVQNIEGSESIINLLLRLRMFSQHESSMQQSEGAFLSSCQELITPNQQISFIEKAHAFSIEALIDLIQKNPMQSDLYCYLSRKLKNGETVRLGHQIWTQLDLCIKAIDLNPGDDACYNLAEYILQTSYHIAFQDQNDAYLEAVKALYLFILQLNPSYSYAYSGLAEVLLEQEYNQILLNEEIFSIQQLCLQAVHHDPANGHAYWIMGKFAKEMEENPFLFLDPFQKSIQELFLISIKLSPSNPKPYLYLYQLHEEDPMSFGSFSHEDAPSADKWIIQAYQLDSQGHHLSRRVLIKDPVYLLDLVEKHALSPGIRQLLAGHLLQDILFDHIAYSEIAYYRIVAALREAKAACLKTDSPVSMIDSMMAKLNVQPLSGVLEPFYQKIQMMDASEKEIASLPPELFQYALIDHPHHHAAIYYNLGRSILEKKTACIPNNQAHAEFFRGGGIDEVIYYFYQAFLLNPDDARIYTGLGKALSGKKKFTLAHFFLSQAIEISPSTPSLYLQAANAFQKSKIYQKDLEAQGKGFDKYCENFFMNHPVHPYPIAIYLDLIELAFSRPLKKLDGSMMNWKQLCIELIEHYPDDPTGYGILSFAYYQPADACQSPMRNLEYRKQCLQNPQLQSIQISGKHFTQIDLLLQFIYRSASLEKLRFYVDNQIDFEAFIYQISHCQTALDRKQKVYSILYQIEAERKQIDQNRMNLLLRHLRFVEVQTQVMTVFSSKQKLYQLYVQGKKASSNSKKASFYYTQLAFLTDNKEHPPAEYSYFSKQDFSKQSLLRRAIQLDSENALAYCLLAETLQADKMERLQEKNFTKNQLYLEAIHLGLNHLEKAGQEAAARACIRILSSYQFADKIKLSTHYYSTYGELVSQAFKAGQGSIYLIQSVSEENFLAGSFIHDKQARNSIFPKGYAAWMKDACTQCIDQNPYDPEPYYELARVTKDDEMITLANQVTLSRKQLYIRSIQLGIRNAHAYYQAACALKDNEKIFRPWAPQQFFTKADLFARAFLLNEESPFYLAQFVSYLVKQKTAGEKRVKELT